jgi:alkanesulfonate monooxygenase SsuD/methylene tetrahydromethanopterin reductase-like flavin-dependent oxidoreductase (luciferase family)
MTKRMRFGAQLLSESTGWPSFRDAALAAEGAGWDSLWAGEAFGVLLTQKGIEAIEGVPNLLGEPAAVADRIRPYRDLGFETIIVRLPAPFDHETIDRVGEVRKLLDD